ncbi:nuclear pore complex protein Nup107 isoform X2 [Nematostella vectensis]|uniref:nuclear pore complex protein Nup107 isoform X2 n=1 Tax=Nematostella vectensis TaxID=45351 RepID=UPI0020773034|nr:nuclear pore complex protein Nup107 isoform X2 [Nematostella vectensis]
MLYSQKANEFNPDDMNVEVDKQRQARDRKRLQQVLKMPEDMPVRAENTSRSLRKRGSIEQSLQLLDDALSPSHPVASPLMKVAGTPAHLLQRPRMAQLRHSTYTPSGMSSVAETDFEQDISISMEGLRPDPNFSTSYVASRSMQDSLRMASGSMLDSSQLESVSHMRSHLDNVTATGGDLEATQLTDMTMLTDRDPIVAGCSLLFQEFKESLTEHIHLSEIFNLVSSYEQACQKQVDDLNKLVREANAHKKSFAKKVDILDSVTQECYTWKLIGCLFSDRLQNTDINEDTVDMSVVRKNWSEKMIVNSLYERDSSVRQSQLVVDWLEHNAEHWMEVVLQMDNMEYCSESVCWENTLHELQHGRSRPGSLRPIVSEMDPDAPVRQRRPLADLDMEDEARLLRYLFVCIRAGKFEEAQRLCIESGQSWRAATLEGWKLYHDSNMEGVADNGKLQEIEGNPNRDIWKAMTWNMASEDKFSLYEKAMYAVYCGNLTQLLPAGNSWEDYLWAYYKVMVDVRVEQELRLNSRKDRPLEPLPSAYWDQVLTPEKVFAELKACPNETIRRSAELPHHVIQTCIILNDIDGLLEIMNKWLNGDEKPSNHMLRFMAHFVLFLRSAGLQTNDEICYSILKAYVQCLIDDHQVPLVATYTATLPQDLQVQTYAYFLEEIVDRKERQKCLEYAEAAHLDIPMITKTVVENIRGKDFQIDSKLSPALEAATSDEDRKKIEAIEWLVFDPSQRAEALKQSNAVMRCFIAYRKHAAARDVFEKIPPDSIDIIYRQWQLKADMSALPPEGENAIREYLCIRAYLSAHDAFNDWFEHFHAAPAPPSSKTHGNFTEKVAHEHRQQNYQAELTRWQNTLDIHTKATLERIYNVLLFPDGGWMVDQSVESEPDTSRLQQMKLLRELCLPALCFILHKVYQSTGQYRECVELANIVASEQYGLYKVFSKDELQKILSAIREYSLAILKNSMDPLGYDSSSVKP